ncbi:MAG: AbrB/MazE/SpoVT family DNA-binding domain-containing protein [Pseudomonadota bacterium]
METVTVSPDFQVVIPKRAREILGLQVGHKIQVMVYEGRMELIPVRPIRQARGFLQGIDTDVKREVDRL